MKRSGKKATEKILAAGLAILLCLLQAYVPVKAQEEEETLVTAKTINVKFDTTYGTGFYLGENGWADAQGTCNIVVEPEMDFSLPIKTEGNFVAGYAWDGGTVTGNLTGENVITKDWENITDNSTLYIYFDEKIASDNFNITFSETQGHYGSTAFATLQSVEGADLNLANVEIKWGSSYGSGFVTGNASAEAGALGRCSYAVQCNENNVVYATAGLYRRGTLLAEVQSEAFYLQKDDNAPTVTEVMYSINGGDFKVLGAGQKIWGAEVVTLRAKVVDLDNAGVACGVSTVNILINDSSQPMVYNGETGFYEYTIEKQAGQVYSFKIKVDACDYVGNSVLEEAYPEIGLDDKGPEVQVALLAGEEEITGWYSEANNEEVLQMSVTATDDNVVTKVEIASTDTFAEGTVLCAETPKLQDGKYVFHTSGELFTGEQNQTYYVRAYDEFGNASEVVAQSVYIDNTEPERKVTVAFTGTENIQVQVSGGDAAGQGYVIETGEGVVYDNEKIALKLMIHDAVITGKEQCVSGVGTVEFKVQITDENGTVTQKYHVEEKEFGVDEEGRTYVWYETELPNGSDSYEAVFQITEVVITDNAGNMCPADVEHSQINDLVYYAVDNQAPGIVYAYENASMSPAGVGSTEEADVYYYAQPFEGTVVISDMNLKLDSVQVENVADYHAAQIGEIEITQQETFCAPTYVSYKLPGDGKYRILTQADDILGNATGENGVKTVYSQIMVVDTKKPVISVSMTGTDGTTYSEYSGSYFGGDMVANIRITDENLDADTLSVTITGKNADGSAFSEQLEKTAWVETNEGFTLQYTFNQEGSYSIHVSCKDMAGNEAQTDGNSFCIDKTAPVVNVAFSNDSANNGMYYNADRVAVITVRDYTFFAEGTSININAQNGTSVSIGEWVHSGTGNCDGIQHTQNCTYTCSVVFDADDIYSLSFSCHDRAGHSAQGYQSGTFVIDKTLPSVTISYDTNEPKNGFYFNTARTAYISIEDLTFASNLVSVETVEGQNVDGLPTLGNFSYSNGKYVLPITFAEDGKYQFVVKVSDLAGNTAPIQQSAYFIVDTTAPALELGGVVDMSANNGMVQPVMVYADTYLDDAKTLITLEGKESGSRVLQYTKTAEGNGYRIVCDDFDYESTVDDWYTLSMKVEDYAGNISEQTLTFSVNRFGSMYMLDKQTEEIIKKYYNGEAQDIKITEINVDELKEVKITCSHNGEIYTLVEGEDYVIEKEGGQNDWNTYSYIIRNECFEADGYYVITLSSTDVAGNKSDNRIKGTEIAFVIDRTVPSVVVEGLEAGVVYRQETQKVTIDAKDNIMLKELQVYLGGNRIQSYDKEMLESNNGVVTFEIGQMQKPEAVKVIATDEAGNVFELNYENILVSTDVWIIREAEAATGSWNDETIAKNNWLLWVLLIGGIALLSIGIAKVLHRKEDAQ